jgi:CheY-like chemotaxis protein
MTAKKPKVLVLESEKWLGDHYERSLERNGFSVIRSSDPYKAIDIIDDHQPSAIVMSLLLNGAGGIGLLHELQSYSDTAKIPVIVSMSLPNVTLEELEPYGVKRLIDNMTMQPDDVANAVRSVTYQEG